MLAEIFGPDLLIVILVGVVVLFGGAAIPKLARNIGSAKKEFEKGVHHGDTDPIAPVAAPAPVVVVAPVPVTAPDAARNGSSTSFPVG
jgi:sec-independent protein translocase protein TatA